VAALRDVLGERDFESAWAEDAALSTDEAIAYARRGRGERKRPASGWASLTPAERDVIRLVSEGLGNKDIAGRLFVSPRTGQSHLTHVYTKLAGASGPGSGAPRECRIGARSGRRLCIHCVVGCVVGAFRLWPPRRLDARLGTRVSLIRRPESHRSFSFSRRTRWEA